MATDLIDSYKNSEKARLKKKFREDNFMFETGYPTLHKTIKRLAKRILNKDISPHSLRHSSATYYASIVKTYQQFCARYGWALRSNTAQRYFHSVDDDEIAGQVKDHEIARFKQEFEKVKLENKQMQEQIANIPNMLKELSKQNLKDLRKALKIKAKI